MPTTRQDRLPNVIAPMAGEDPIWFVDSSGGQWSGGAPVKSVWVLTRRQSGALRVTGRERHTGRTVQFRRGLDGALTESLVINDPQAETMIPGGASPEVMSKFAFVSAYLHFPSPGCWEIRSEWAGAQRSVFVLLK